MRSRTLTSFGVMLQVVEGLRYDIGEPIHALGASYKNDR
jgi:hypothetical protein